MGNRYLFLQRKNDPSNSAKEYNCFLLLFSKCSKTGKISDTAYKSLEKISKTKVIKSKNALINASKQSI